MATVDRLKAPKSGQRDYQRKGGLWVRVFASGRRVFYIRGRVRGRKGSPLFVLCGEWPGTDEHAAAVAAATARKAMRDGIDPNLQHAERVRKARAHGLTFSELVDEYLEAMAKKVNGKDRLRPTTLKNRGYILRSHHFSDWRDRPVASITQDEVKALAAGVQPNSQVTVIGGLRTLLNFAKGKNYIERAPTDHVSIETPEGDAAPLVKFAEGKAPDFSELVAFLGAVELVEEQRPLSPWPSIFRVGALTGARISSLVAMRWDQLDLEGDAPTWRMPAEISKIKRASAIPLSSPAAEILRGLSHRGELVWPGKNGKSPLLPRAKIEGPMLSAALAAKGFKTGFWYGRLRDTVASWLEFQSDATERAMALILNHKPPAGNTRRRHYALIGAEHQARVLVSRWASTIDAARAGTKSADVVAMRRR